MHGRQALPLAHVHPAVEAKCAIERIERVITRRGVQCVEFGGEPYGDPLTQEPTEMGDASADGRRDQTDPLREVPYRQPFLEELRPILSLIHI